MKKKSFYLTEAGTGRQILVTPCSFDYAVTPTESEEDDHDNYDNYDNSFYYGKEIPEETNSIVCLCGETFYVTEKLSDIAYQLDNMED